MATIYLGWLAPQIDGQVAHDAQGEKGCVTKQNLELTTTFRSKRAIKTQPNGNFGIYKCHRPWPLLHQLYYFQKC